MRKTLTAIPFTLDADEIVAQARVPRGSSDEADLLSLVELARQVGRPKAAYAACFVTERDGDAVRIEDVWFRSRTLARNLASAERAFAMLATCGREMDEHFPARGDMLQEFWWDLIKMRLLGAASRDLAAHVHRTFRLGKTASMHPGSGDASVWPIEQQGGLFRLLGGMDEEIGVRLTDSFLMVPNKTTSGLLFPTERDFRSCEVCHRAECPSRQAPFNQALWDETHGD